MGLVIHETKVAINGVDNWDVDFEVFTFFGGFQFRVGGPSVRMLADHVTTDVVRSERTVNPLEGVYRTSIVCQLDGLFFSKRSTE